MAEQVARRDIAAQAIAAEVAKDRAQKRRKHREHSEMLSPIEQFNADHDLTQVLLECGWEPRSRACYASPYSQSKGPSVYVYDQRAVSFSSSDAGQLGKETANGWTTYDAYTVAVSGLLWIITAKCPATTKSNCIPSLKNGGSRDGTE